MNRRLISCVSCVFLLVLLAAASGLAWAQDDEDEEEPPEQKWAWLVIDFDTQGGAHANLSVQQKPKSWEPLRAALAGTLHCSAAQFSNPQSDYSKNLPFIKQSERYRASIARANQRRLSGNCAGVLTGDDWIRRASLDIAPLAEALRAEGVTSLSVNLSYPTAGWDEFSQEGLERGHEDPAVYKQLFGQSLGGHAAYNFAIGQGPSPGPIRIAFGFRPRDLRTSELIALGFVLFPILIILWMRHTTLKAADEDTMGAWFSYHRTVNWCVTGAFLLWAFADFGARETMDRFISFRYGKEAVLPPLISAAMVFAPFLVVYATSVALSHQVFVRLRKREWKLGNYLVVQLLHAGSSILPLMFVVAGFELLMKHTRIGIACFALAYIVFLVCTTWRLRAAKAYAQAMTTGELRDKIFELAKRAAVAVRQVFVLPAGKGQVANAYAARSNVVIFTDYLLERLSKREVNTVAGHELTHLQKRHPAKLTLAFLAAIFAPTWGPAVILWIGTLAFTVTGLSNPEKSPSSMINFYRVWAAFGAWPFRDLLLILLGFSGFYFLARRFEFTADAGAVTLTGDPEAAITALLKLNRLNLVPIQWSKASGAWLTHPATLRRVERIAEQGGLPPERLRQILEQYSSPAAPTTSDDHYATPPASEDRLLSLSAQTMRARFNLWILIVFHWLPAVAVALWVQSSQWEDTARAGAYLLGLVATLGIYLVAMRWLGVRGRTRIQSRLLEKARQEGIPLDVASPLTVGMSPGTTPRFYVTSYNWDTGLLLLTREKLYFLGTQLRCALRREQVLDLCLGPGAPGWVSMPRVYLRWHDAENHREGTLNLASAEPCSAWDLARKARMLFERVSEWKQGKVAAADIPELQTLSSPALGEVTSLSPKALTSPGKSLRVWLVLVLPVAIAACILLGVQAISYVVLATGLVRILEFIPHWRYRERPAFALRAPQTLGSPAVQPTKNP